MDQEHIVIRPLRWFFCFLGCGSFHFVPCIPPFLGALVFFYDWQGFIIWWFLENGCKWYWSKVPTVCQQRKPMLVWACHGTSSKLSSYINYINSLHCLTFSLLRNIVQNSSPSESHGTCPMLVLGPKSWACVTSRLEIFHVTDELFSLSRMDVFGHCLIMHSLCQEM